MTVTGVEMGWTVDSRARRGIRYVHRERRWEGGRWWGLLCEVEEVRREMDSSRLNPIDDLAC